MRSGIVTVQLGKNGITDGFIELLRKTFKNRKMVKITLLKSYTRDREEAKRTVEEICEKLKDVGNFKHRVIGFTIALIKWRK